LRPGDALSLPAPLAPLEVTVGAVRPDYLLDLGSVTVPWTTFVRHFGAQGANILFVDKEPGVAAPDLKRRIDRTVEAGAVSVLTVDELRTMTDALIDRSFALTTALQILAAIVTVLAMINATSATILDRSFELATWRAIGMERARLIRLLVLEAGLTGLCAGGLGLAAGSFVGRVLVLVVAPAVTGFRMPLDWPVEWAPASLTATVTFAAATAWAVARTRMPWRIVLRERRA
jgi:putative ABC transport system permease protein